MEPSRLENLHETGRLLDLRNFRIPRLPAARFRAAGRRRVKKLDGKPTEPASIHARARYAKYCAHKDALSKANLAMTSDLLPLPTLTSCMQRIPSPPIPTRTQSHTQPPLSGFRRSTPAIGERKKPGTSTSSNTSVSSTLPSTSALAPLSSLRTLTGGARVS